ncbi:phosphatase PAP2 family protein [Aphanothece sacrum]|uniref:Phosphatidic acid phosphatase type 2/haloperoxidase domain-containing protein n=1 Tax=Aphanothece sacrum FPU1 TaxID=1920663 RepID=A0A401IH58_APHSA|nr:phosphatase PAP2 family protein [Aphanothece sacrum]GBF80574.1 hypothetical protein AsFPU1_1977 [Aphanothece sacrum FPU1]GBF84036.1 hypothetical protein AsFPU3_1081 [Aphanothece sacrum FPU3]
MKLNLRLYTLNKINKDLVFCLITFLLLVWLTLEVISGNLDAWDHAFLDWIRHFHHPSLMILARVSYFLGEAEVAVFVVLIALIFLCWKRLWNEAFVLGISSLGVLLLIDKILKPWFGRIRPAPGVIDVHGKSFPSGHISGNFMLYLFFAYLIAFYFPKWGIYAYIAATILAGMMGWASIYLNIHWLTDLIAGCGVAYLGFMFSITLLKRVEKKYRNS